MWWKTSYSGPPVLCPTDITLGSVIEWRDWLPLGMRGLGSDSKGKHNMREAKSSITVKVKMSLNLSSCMATNV
jgi:hypothetical protein